MVEITTTHEHPVDEHDHPHINHKRSMKRQILLSLLVLSLLILGTTGVILYGKGYRIGFQDNKGPQLSKTGILQIKSKPTGAQVYIDGNLSGATDDDITLTPGKYTVRVTKDGYNDWQKDVQVEREIVSSIEALLRPKAPTLQSISTFGVESAVVDPTGTKIAFRIASSSAEKNGIYVLELTNRVFPVLAGQSNSTQIVDETIDNFSQATISWSPDGKQILASIPLGESSTYYLLKSDGFNTTPQNITLTVQNVTKAWKEQVLDKQTARIKSLKPKVQQFVQNNFRILAFSPDDTKILYQATVSAQMPIFLKPRLIGNNLLYERRDLKESAIYVYDIKEDINTRIIDTIDVQCSELETDCIRTFTWFPDSNHLLYVHDKKIEIVEDDGSNMTTVYAGPFVDHYVYPWPDGSKIVVLTNLGNSNTPPTLYTITLK
jgi:hypothetical protein